MSELTSAHKKLGVIGENVLSLGYELSATSSIGSLR